MFANRNQKAGPPTPLRFAQDDKPVLRDDLQTGHENAA